MKPYGSYHGGDIDSISLTNGNLFLQAPLFSYPQRGNELSSQIVLEYNNKSFSFFPEPCAKPELSLCKVDVVFGAPPDGSSPSASLGNSVTIGYSGRPSVFSSNSPGVDTGFTLDGVPQYVTLYSVLGPDGSVHQLAQTGADLLATDGSGFRYQIQTGLLFDRNGSSFGNSLAFPPGFPVTDRNGNSISTTVDTLQRSILGAPGSGNPSATPPASTASLSECPVLSYSYQPVSYAYYWDIPSYGGSVQLTLCYATVRVRTAYGGNFVDLNQDFTMLQSVVFPDQTYWAFEYDAADPGDNTSIRYGDLLQVHFPTGGTISYTWGPWNGCPNLAARAGSNLSRAVLTRTVDDGSGPQSWRYDSSVGSTTVTDPEGNQTVHTITALGARCSLYETGTQYYQGAAGGTPLKTVSTEYYYTENPYDTTKVSRHGATPDTVTNVFPKSVTTILPNGQQNKVEMTYDNALVYHGPLDGIQHNFWSCTTDPNTGTPEGCAYSPTVTEPVTTYTGSFGSVTDKKEYDWGRGAPGALLRETKTTYQWQVDGRYLTANLVDLPSSIQIYDGAGHLCARTDYTYDEGTPASSGITTQHGPTPSAVRGNLTTVTRWVSATPCQAGAAWTQIASHTAYFDTGEVASSSDPLGHTTAHSYDAAYAGAYPTQTCSPQTGAVTHCVSGAYDFNSGLLTSFTDENNQVSSFQYDNRWRMTMAKSPADSSGQNPETDFLYPDPLTVTRKKKLDITGAVIQDDAAFDGLGRSKQTTLHDPEGNDLVDTTYDALGRVSTVSNPHRSTASSTDGITTTYYDALGRVVQVAPQDGTPLPAGTSPTSCQPNNICTDYSNFPTVTVTDQAGKLRRSRTDALGRLVEVDEPGPGANTAGTQPWATINVSGSLQSNTTPGTKATATVTVSGIEHSSTRSCIDTCVPVTRFYDTGTVRISANGAELDGSFGQGDLSSTVAARMVGSFGGITATYAGGSTVTLTANTAGPDYSFTTSSSNDDNVDFPVPSFNASPTGGTLSGGVYPVTTYDSGTLSVTVDGFTASASYNQSLNNTPQAMASALAAVLNVASSPVTAQANGSSITITAKVVGSSGEYAVTGGSTASFTASSATLGNDTNPGGLFTPYQTFYTYDPLGNLLQVNQQGDGTQPARTRTFTYDSLSRLLTAHNPESGTITYSYDADGNLLQKTSPAPNQTGTTTQIVSYCYDALHRVTGKGYGAQSCPLSSPAVTYTYDTGPNGIGHLTSLTDQAGTGAYTYDPLGRITSETRVIAGVSKSMSYEYNLDGSVKALHYPSGAVVNYTPDSAGRMLSAVDSANSINYATAATYSPDGSLAGFLSGKSATFAGVTNAFSYNKRLQPVNMSASAPSQTVFSIGYDFHFGSGNNGNVYAITNFKDNSRNQTFTYDALNRLTSAQNAGTNCATTTVNGKTEYWGNSYGYDPWGNLVNKTITKCGAENFSVAALANNQLSGYSYDAAGNMTHDLTSGMTYSYDQENRITGAAGYAYTYDADGNRVKKSNGTTGTLYWYMTPGIVAESDLSGTLKSEYVFFDGERVARRDFGTPGGVFYYFSDHLKTASVITDSAGNIKAESDYYPWGGELQFVNSDTNHYKFTGKERDSETGLDYFGARYYSNALARFISADYSSTPIPVPYADFSDPQSLNLYSYVRNIPTSRADLDGHDGTVTLGPFIVTPQLLNSIQNIPSDLQAAAHSFLQFMTSGPLGPPMLPSPNPNCTCPAAQQQNNVDNNSNNSFRSNEQGRDAQGKFVSKQPGQAAPGANAEKEGLESVGAVKNNSEVLNGTKRDGTIPETGQHVEIKSGEVINRTEQLQKMGQAAVDNTKQPLKVVTTNPDATVSGPAQRDPNLQIEPMKKK